MFLARAKGVLRLNAATFEEIEADESATMQAFWIVAMIALLNGLALFLGSLWLGPELAELQRELAVDLPLPVPVLSPAGLFVQSLVTTLLGWLLWSAATYVIGTRLFGGQATLAEMLRVIGFAQFPRLLSIVQFIPCLGDLLNVIGWVWALAAGFVGIRQGLDLSNGRTIVTVLISFLLVALVNWFIVGPILVALAF